MSQLASRSTAFLTEMGVGPQWTLRHRPAGTAAEAAEGSDAGVSAATVATVASPAAADLAEVAGIASVAAVASPALAEAPPVASVAVPEAPPAPAPVAAQAEPEPALAAEPESEPATPVRVESTAAASMPSAAPVAERPTVVAPAANPPAIEADYADASTAWFDDAPAPVRPAAVSEQAIATMDWPALQAAVASCTRCELCSTRRSAVPGRPGGAGATWLALGTAPGRLDEKERRPMAGEAGQLLDNMFKAIGVVPDQLYVSNLLKCRPAAADGSEQPATAAQLAACRPFLERELELAGTRLILTLGQSAAKGLLGAAARGRVLRHGALPVVATYHPDDLLRRPEDKAKAWADLCLARSTHDGHA